MTREDLRSRSIKDLLALHAGVMDALREAGITRSANNPVADLTEHLVCSALGLTRDASNSKAGFDAVDASGLRYQIKGRRLTPQNGSVELSAIRRLKDDPFDFLIGVIYRPDFSIDYAAQIPRSVIETRATFKIHTNAHCFRLTRGVLSDPLVVDVTERLAAFPLEQLRHAQR